MKRKKELRVMPVLMTLAALLLPACDGNGGVVLAPDEDQETEEVLLTQNLTFDPQELTISPGTPVRWINVAPVYHTITPEGHTEWIQDVGMTGTITVE